MTDSWRMTKGRGGDTARKNQLFGLFLKGKPKPVIS